MWIEVFYYVAASLIMVVGLLVIERIVAGSHVTSGTGYARVDSTFDLDRLRRHQYAARIKGLAQRHGRSAVPLMEELDQTHRQLRDAGEQLIPIASIAGSVDGTSQLFDQRFRPVSERANARLNSVLVAMREGAPLPPIEVWAWHGAYYVVDGHHRVAAARALGYDLISARVIGGELRCRRESRCGPVGALRYSEGHGPPVSP